MSKYTPTGIPGLTLRSGKYWLRFKMPDGRWTEQPTDYVPGQETEALRALEQVKRSLAAGAELKGKKSGPVTVGDFVEAKFFPLRRDTVEDWKSDETRLKAHVLSFKTDAGVLLRDMPIREVRTRHLVAAFLAFRKKRKPNGKPYAPKSIWNTYGVVQALFRDARREELIFEDPCVLDERDLGANVDADPEWRKGAIYEMEELELLISSPLIPPDRQVWYALEGIGAIRAGEGAALRWRHYRPNEEPLGSLLIAKSHGKEHTKTKRPREMPVHPVLAAILSEWRMSGWVKMMGRHPTPDDLIVPVSAPEKGKGRRLQLGAMRTEKYISSRTKADLAALGLRHRRGHDLRATFITFALAHGAPEFPLEACTHTPRSQSAFQKYNRIPWPTRCAAVACLKVQRQAPARGELIPLKAAVGHNPSSDSSAVTPPLPNGANMRIVGRKQVEAAGIEPVASVGIGSGRSRSKAVDGGNSEGLAAKPSKSASVDGGRRNEAGNGVTKALDAARDAWVDGGDRRMLRRALLTLLADLDGGDQ